MTHCLRARFPRHGALVLALTALVWSPTTVSAQRPPEADSENLKEAVRLTREVHQLYGQGRYDAALPLAERILAIVEKDRGRDDPTVANAADVLARLHAAKPDYGRAEVFYQRALGIREKALGPEHPDVATSLNNLAVLHQAKHDHGRAEPLYQRALRIREKALGREHPAVAATLNNLAVLHEAKGDYGRAEARHQRALAIRENTLGLEHPMVAQSLDNLAQLYEATGDYGRPELLYQRALEIREKALGPEHLDVALSLNNLAGLYRVKGDDGRAEPLHQRALAIREKALGPEHPTLAMSLHNLAVLHAAKGDYGRAEPFYQRALGIQEKALGREHPIVAGALYSLAALHAAKGDYGRAEPLYQRALALFEKAKHPGVAATLNNLALLHAAKGDYGRAESFHQRALATAEKVLGGEHPVVGQLLINLARLYWVKQDVARAVTLQARGNEVEERTLRLALDTGLEAQKRAYLAKLTENTDATLSLHIGLARNDLAALRLALTTALRRKGRVLDAVTDSLAALRRRLTPADATLLDEWASARSEMATLILKSAREPAGAPARQRIAALTAQTERLEAQISLRSSELREHAQPVTLERVQRAVPPGAALVEIVSYQTFDPRAATRGVKSGVHRYVGYVLRDRGHPAWVDLGARDEMDREVARLRDALARPDRADVKQVARALDERLMRPLRPLLGEARTILLSPDGALNLLPFGALVDETGHYLIERFSFAYLTTGRDLLRPRSRGTRQTDPLVVADPDFDDTVARPAASPTAAERGGEPRRSPDLGAVQFARLPGTAGEASMLARLLPGAKVLTGPAATETALKRVQGPSIVHVATHGFFLPDQARDPGTTRRDIGVTGDLIPSTPEGWAENPLLRSGLALAGANARQSGDDDGILTALEAAGLDLWGTKLVVLSACETGVGTATTGDGVYGLRRALVIAGAESQMLSLWKVDDDATRDLMIAYYRRILAGEGRAEALRQGQLELLRSTDRRHPFFWSSFIAGGDWRPIDGLVAAPRGR